MIESAVITIPDYATDPTPVLLASGPCKVTLWGDGPYVLGPFNVDYSTGFKNGNNVQQTFNLDSGDELYGAASSPSYPNPVNIYVLRTGA